MNARGLFIAGCVISLAVLCLAILAAVLFAGELPNWLLAIELLICLSLALAWGFSGFFPLLSPWLKCRPIQGAMLVTTGVVVVFLPLTFVVAAALIGAGCRLVWLEACELERRASNGNVPPTTTVVHRQENAGPVAKPREEAGVPMNGRT